MTLCLWFPSLAEAGPREQEVLESTFKLFNPDSTATCFLVRDPEIPGETWIVTAAHVLEGMKGEEAVLVLRKRDDKGIFLRQDRPVQVRKGEAPLWTRHPDLDVAALPLDLEEAESIPALPFESLLSRQEVEKADLGIGEALFVLGYPTRFETDKAGFPVARHATVASYPLAPVDHYQTFIVDFSTFEGDSGGPVILKGDRLPHRSQPSILGIVLAQWRHTEKIKGFSEERTVHHALDLSTILHAAYIRDTIHLAREAVPETVPEPAEAGQ